MKKLWILPCGAMLLGALGLTGCAKEEGRTRYDMTLAYDPSTRTLEGEMTADVLNRSENALTELTFHLWPNAYREGAKYAPVSDLFAPAAYYDGKSYGSVTVRHVEGATGFSVEGADETLLRLTLPEPLYPDERATVGMTFTVTLAAINHRLGVGEHAVTFAHFYPVLCAGCEAEGEEHVFSALGESFASECADYAVTFTIPDSYTVAHTGTGECTLSEGTATYTLSAENVRDFALVASEQFTLAEGSANGIPVAYYFFDDPTPERTLAIAQESLSYFAGQVSAYQYPAYVVVETDIPYGGAEYPMLSMIASDLREGEVPRVVAHETAHQWWYAMVGSDPFCEPWQDEALAEYCAALFLDAHPAYGTDYAACVSAAESAYRAFFSVWTQIADGEQTAMRRPLTAFRSEYEYRNVVYDKGLILFDRLDELLGREKTMSALRAYAKQFSGKIAQAEDLIACFSARGAYAEGVFDSFLTGTCVI